MNVLKIIKNIFLSSVIAILILSVFGFFYDYNGLGILDSSGATSTKRRPHQFTSYMAEGHSIKFSDANGYYNVENAPASGPQILLMGDSHMEAKQIMTEDSLGALLNESYPTYNIGVSDHDIEYSVQNLQNAIEAFQPAQYVIIETSDCSVSIDRMQAALDGDVFFASDSEVSGIRKFLSLYFPGVSNLYRSLRHWIRASENSQPGEKTELQFDQAYQTTLNAFIKKASDTAKDHGLQLIIFRMHDLTVNSDGQIAQEEETEQKAVKLFREACQSHDVVFVDMRESFCSLYRDEHKLPFGFCNSMPGVGHLNKDGHRVVSRKLLAAIENLEN